MIVISILKKLGRLIKKSYYKIRKDFVGFLMTVLIYTAVLGIYSFILLAAGSLSAIKNFWSIFLALLLLIALAFISRIRFLGDIDKISEDSVSNKDHIIEQLKKENGFLKEKAKNQVLNVLNMDWLMEINLLQFKTEFKKVFDYFIPKVGEKCLWKDRPQENKIEVGSKRAIGCLTVQHTSKVGIDLRKVIISINDQEGKAYYFMPKPHVTGSSDADPKWDIKLGLEMKKSLPMGKKVWALSDEQLQTELSLFRHESEEAIRIISGGEYDLDQRSSALTIAEARRRVEGIIQGVLKMEPVAVETIPSGEIMELKQFLSQNVEKETKLLASS